MLGYALADTQPTKNCTLIAAFGTDVNKKGLLAGKFIGAIAHRVYYAIAIIRFYLMKQCDHLTTKTVATKNCTLTNPYSFLSASLRLCVFA
jgi:hypothetical protein